MPHANARLTVHGRRLIVERARAGWKQAHIAAAMGVSRRCVKRWIDRYRTEGEAGLLDRSSRPHSSPTRAGADVEEAALELRQRERIGRDEIAARLGLSPRTVSRILARHGIPPLRTLDPITGEVIRASKTTAVRYEWDRPGELVHMDVKKLGKIPDGGGWKAHGRASGSILRDRNTKVGFDYVHSLVDDHSRLAYSEVLPDEKGPTCAAFLERTIAYLAAHGITRIERLITDNAWSYRWSLREVCAAHGIRQKFIKPHFPWQNGKAERFNRTLQTEWAYRQAFLTNADRTATLAPWLEHYNTGRRHSALGGHPPVSRLAPT
ncbi:transposase [Leifsonia xyli subsp. xyli]|uniref:Transposase, undefined n=2 Tax=Leifsonia xyli subsp. xyli TaxID=59736 RepID=Q6ACH7_LEIXX|nr:IS481 family transposase [Leifsonia xyli]AAT89916.1 transposase, undefined [Leifsonia xyli subsp. xyli str. CTCB07]ODA89842.1 transposase [Leifsonia xyli subsp. xyli]